MKLRCPEAVPAPDETNQRDHMGGRLRIRRDTRPVPNRVLVSAILAAAFFTAVAYGLMNWNNHRNT